MTTNGETGTAPRAIQGHHSVPLIHGDARALPLASCSVDAIVCDPPYGLEFMGAEWDGADGFRRQLNPADVGRSSVFGRTSARAPEYRSKAKAGMAATGSIVGGDGVLPSFLGGLNPKCRICDCWQRGSNPCACPSPDFPNERGERMEVFQSWCESWAHEALRVAKPGAHLIAFGSTRTHHRLHSGVEDAGWEIRDMGVWLYRNGFPKQRAVLKPAFETWLVARKPCSERNVALNVERWGTGWLNVQGSRIPFAGSEDEREAKDKNRHADFDSGPRENAVYGTDNRDRGADGNYDPEGRHPSNIVTLEDDWDLRHFRLSAGLADFAKAGSDERPWDAKADRGPRQSSTGSPVEPGEFGGNPDAQHPTVKPVALMRHLVRLACPPGGIVLDPFLGSGTTLEAATLEGYRAVGVELKAAYLPLTIRRLSKPLQPSLLGGVA